jgi:8-oxo-dGTP pyrophosphatase MutT (NUDIX family)
VTAGQRPASAGEVPGWLRELAAAVAVMPVPPQLRPPDGQGRPSAVLVLFGYGDEPDAGGRRDPDLLLIQRRPGLRRHAGQPAFPGGAIEPEDESPVHAALREAAEEVGVDPSGVDVVAVAPELFIERSGFRVIPVLGWWRRPVAVSPADPAEVASVARVRVSELADPANRLTIRHPSGFTGPAFQVSGMLVWGFTAGLLDMLLTLGGWQIPWDRSRIGDLPPDTTDPAGDTAKRAGHGA